MNAQSRFTTRVALIVALGGFLMGFDASVISGVVGFIEVEFGLSKLQLGWSVASLTLTATLAMMVAGPLSDRYGRRPILSVAAIVFALSAIASALAPNFLTLVVARMLGGFGVGAALIVAPMYIAEIAPAKARGRLVSFNQLNIVVGISAAFFSNYAILRLGQSDLPWAEFLGIGEWSWRWMLAIEALPAIIYFLVLFGVPESPRWLAMHGQKKHALTVLEQSVGRAQAEADLSALYDSLQHESRLQSVQLRELFQPAMKLVLTIGVSVAILQQITGINSVFFYAPMIFAQTGIGTDASFMQAVLVGLVNLVFTVIAMSLIDRLGRRPLLGVGLAGITICMLTLAWGFHQARYQLEAPVIETIIAETEAPLAAPASASLRSLAGITYESDLKFRAALTAAIGTDAFKQNEAALLNKAIQINASLILFGILGFVAAFAVSLGPVMWVLFSELFPNRLRGLAISFVGLINSAVSFTVQLVFPWELEQLGNATTFLIYGLFALVGLVLLMRILPETRGKSLEEVERLYVGA